MLPTECRHFCCNHFLSLSLKMVHFSLDLHRNWMFFLGGRRCIRLFSFTSGNIFFSRVSCSYSQLYHSLIFKKSFISCFEKLCAVLPSSKHHVGHLPPCDKTVLFLSSVISCTWTNPDLHAVLERGLLGSVILNVLLLSYYYFCQENLLVLSIYLFF